MLRAKSKIDTGRKCLLLENWIGRAVRRMVRDEAISSPTTRLFRVPDCEKMPWFSAGGRGYRDNEG